MDNFKGNITTIVKFAVMIVAPYFGVAEATSNQIIAIIVAVIGLILAYFDAKYDNTLISQPNVEEVADEQYLWQTEHVNCKCVLPEDIEQSVLDACEEDAVNQEYYYNEGDGA